jgi:hypothetical protein
LLLSELLESPDFELSGLLLDFLSSDAELLDVELLDLDVLGVDLLDLESVT